MASRSLTGTLYLSAASSNSASSEEYGDCSWAKTQLEPTIPSKAAPTILAPLNLRKPRRFIAPGASVRSLERIPPLPGIVSPPCSSVCLTSRNNLSIFSTSQQNLKLSGCATNALRGSGDVSKRARSHGSTPETHHSGGGVSASEA